MGLYAEKDLFASQDVTGAYLNKEIPSGAMRLRRPVMTVGAGVTHLA
jgi:hypothetical protein